MTAEIYAGLDVKNQFRSRNKIKIYDKHEIIDSVSCVLEVSKDAIIGQCRQRDIVMARQIAIGLIKRYNPDLSLVNIGKMFNRDHSTIIYSLGVYDDLYGRDKIFTARVKKVLSVTNFES